MRGRVTTFRDVDAFRAWLEKHHASESELLVRCYKTKEVHRGLTYRQVLDEALCFGWIDGVRHRVDAISFSVRFTPRKPESAWSRVNIRRATELAAEGRMHAAGLAAFARRRQPSYSYESRPQTLHPSFVKRLRASKEAWSFFQAQPPWYRQTSAFWVMSAKRPETREARFRILLSSSKAAAPIPLLERSRIPILEDLHGARRASIS